MRRAIDQSQVCPSVTCRIESLREPGGWNRNDHWRFGLAAILPPSSTCLWVDVNNHRHLSGLFCCHGQVQGHGRFSAAPLLAQDRYCVHAPSLPLCRIASNWAKRIASKLERFALKGEDFAARISRVIAVLLAIYLAGTLVAAACSSRS
jgi:hypothetical protein